MDVNRAGIFNIPGRFLIQIYLHHSIAQYDRRLNTFTSGLDTVGIIRIIWLDLEFYAATRVIHFNKN